MERDSISMSARRAPRSSRACPIRGARGLLCRGGCLGECNAWMMLARGRPGFVHGERRSCHRARASSGAPRDVLFGVARIISIIVEHWTGVLTECNVGRTFARGATFASAARVHGSAANGDRRRPGGPSASATRRTNSFRLDFRKQWGRSGSVRRIRIIKAGKVRRSRDAMPQQPPSPRDPHLSSLSRGPHEDGRDVEKRNDAAQDQRTDPSLSTPSPSPFVLPDARAH